MYINLEGSSESEKNENRTKERYKVLGQIRSRVLHEPIFYPSLQSYKDFKLSFICVMLPCLLLFY